MKKTIVRGVMVCSISLALVGCASPNKPSDGSIADQSTPQQDTNGDTTDSTNTTDDQAPVQQGQGNVVCTTPEGVFATTEDEDFQDMQDTTVSRIKKINSENTYRVFQYMDDDIDAFLSAYREQTAFPGEAQIQVTQYTDDSALQRTLLDIGLEEQIRYTSIHGELIVVQDLLAAKGCEGPNCIQETVFLDLLTCTSP